MDYKEFQDTKEKSCCVLHAKILFPLRRGCDPKLEAELLVRLLKKMGGIFEWDSACVTRHERAEKNITIVINTRDIREE